MRNRIVFAVIAVGAACVLGGCSAAAPGSGPQGPAAGGDSNVLHLNYTSAPYLDATVKEFRRQHPRIEVKVTNAPLTFEDGTVQTHLRSGKGSDVLLVNSGPGRVGTLANAGLIADLSDFYKKNSIADEYPEEIVAQTKSEDGKIYEVVEGRDIFQLYYNSAIFDAAGIQPPTTWDELLDTCEPLTAQGVRPLVAGARDNFAGGWLLGALVQSSAGQDAMRGVLFDGESFAQSDIVRGGRYLSDLIDAGCVDGTEALALDFEQAGVAFGQGKAAMIVGTQATIPDLTDDGNDMSTVAAIAMPSQKPANQVPTSGLALSWVVNAKTSAMPAALEWMKWVTSDEYLEFAVKNGMSFAPAHTVPASVELDPAVAQAVDSAERGTGFNPSVYLSATAKEAWYAAVQGLLSGNGDSASLMRDVQSARDADGN